MPELPPSSSSLYQIPENFRFIADGYSAYPLAAQQFFHQFGEKFRFDITQAIRLTNEDEVSKKFRPFKQMVERLNRTFKVSYRVTCGYDNYEGANYNVSLWVAYYNFLRPHQHNNHRVLNKAEHLENADNMPDKWQLFIFLGNRQSCRCRSLKEKKSVPKFRAGDNSPAIPEGFTLDGTQKQYYNAVTQTKKPACS